MLIIPLWAEFVHKLEMSGKIKWVLFSQVALQVCAVHIFLSIYKFLHMGPTPVMQVHRTIIIKLLSILKNSDKNNLIFILIHTLTRWKPNQNNALTHGRRMYCMNQN